MALTGNKIDLVLGLKLNEFFAANKRAAATYSKTKTNIEKKPIKIREDGTKNILKRLAQVGIAYIGIRKVVQDLTTSQTNLANIASLGVENIGEIGKGIQQIGLDVPIALHDIEQGMYQVVSAGVDAANQIEILELSARSAKAGLAQTNDALNLGSSVIKGYGKEWGAFEGVMDQAFQTVKLGQTTFPELAANLGKVVPLASTLKVETEELFGAFATLTGVTGNTAEVATQLRGIFAATVKPTAELTEAFKEYGGAAKALEQLGLAGYLEQIAEKTGGNTQQMGKLIPRVEGLNAVLALSGTQFDTFIEKTDAMREASGAMGEAFDIQAETLDSKITKLDNSFQIFSQTILSGAVPAITAIIDLGNDFFKWFTQLDEGTQKALLAITILTPLLLKLPAIITSIRLAITGLAVSLGPAGWLVLGLSAAAAAFVLFTDEANAAATANRNLKQSMDELAVSMAAVIKRAHETDSLEKLIERHEFYNEKLDEEIAKLKRFETLGAPESMIKKQEQTIRNYQTALNQLDDLIEKRKKFEESLVDETPEDDPVVKAEIAKIEEIENLKVEFNKKEETEYKKTVDNKKNIDKDYFVNYDNLSQMAGNSFARNITKQLVDGKPSMESFFNSMISLVEKVGERMLALEIEKLFSGGKDSGGGFKASSLLNFIPGFGPILAGIGGFLGFAGGGVVKGFPGGGLIFPSDVTRSAHSPPGEDGLIAAQIGEMVINRRATSMFYPLLDSINRAGRGKTSFATGGVVEDTIGGGDNSEMFAAIVEDAIAKGLNRSRLRITGEFRAKGKDLKSTIDKTEELTVTL